LAASATSDLDLINSEVGLTAKHQAEAAVVGVVAIRDEPEVVEGSGEWELIHFVAACALSVGVNFDEQPETLKRITNNEKVASNK